MSDDEFDEDGGSSQASMTPCYNALCTKSYHTMLYIPTIIHLAYIDEFLPQPSRYLVGHLLAQQRLEGRFDGVHGVP